MMVQLEFLQGEHVNHYGNFGGWGEKKKLALDIFLCSGGCGTQMNSSSHPSAAHPSPHPHPPPQVLPKQSLHKFLVQFLAKHFPLEFTKEVNRKMVPPIFLFDVGETS